MLIETGLGAFLESTVGNLAKKVLSTLGVGVVSYTGVTGAMQAALDAVKGYFDAIPQAAFDLLGLAGFGTFFAMIATAIMYRVGMQIMRKTFGILSPT
ncbi:Protein of unknown function [Nitrosomonas eutropha]|uniref:DUF2523 domain-containing protein n=1 Tax=Nitrosomonas eutropha TaxID=916 RepID=A0A1I7JDK4_9PROT|nr:DUF2523 domain-containing protein [Nitrosomonas eutropha]SFU83269.1 Protein of unknown function [Nitrosomonas eutropha]